MSWLKNKRKYNFGGDDLPCPCPTDRSTYTAGCATINGSRNWCELFRDKWVTTDCAAQNTACLGGSSDWGTETYCTIEDVFCFVFNVGKGVGLTLLQYGTLPAVIAGTAVAAGYIKYAES
jgi:hypothetical protein